MWWGTFRVLTKHKGFQNHGFKTFKIFINNITLALSFLRAPLSQYFLLFPCQIYVFLCSSHKRQVCRTGRFITHSGLMYRAVSVK